MPAYVQQFEPRTTVGNMACRAAQSLGAVSSDDGIVDGEGARTAKDGNALIVLKRIVD